MSNDLWRFSCTVYAAPGVAEACLYLQDRYGADVNLLLLAAWLGSMRGVRMEMPLPDAIADASWQEAVIRPLRAVRRRVKAGGLDDPSFREFHAQLLATELAAERIRQAQLFHWAEHHFPPRPAVAGLARANLALLTGSPPEAAAALDQLAEAAEARGPES
ncbi:TIGR02444 family protein [Roseomonas sp. KE2513]|nr:TIGR02444 family protein [Roseomonas sp. KE2513]